MLKKSSVHVAVFAAISLCLLQPASAVAGTITVFDLTENITFVVSPDIASRVTGGCVGELCSFTIQDPVGTVGASFSPRTNIFGPDGIISDTFQFLNGSPTFQSDSDTGPALVPFPLPFASITENGTVQQVGTVTFHDVTGGNIETDTMFFQSDASPEAPEPVSTLMMLGGFGAMLMMNRGRLAGPRSQQF